MDVRVVDEVQLGDLPQFVDVDDVAGAAAVNAAGLWSLANAPGTPRDVKVDVTRLTNDPTPSWSVDDAAAGYVRSVGTDGEHSPATLPLHG